MWTVTLTWGPLQFCESTTLIRIIRHLSSVKFLSSLVKSFLRTSTSKLFNFSWKLAIDFPFPLHVKLQSRSSSTLEKFNRLLNEKQINWKPFSYSMVMYWRVASLTTDEFGSISHLKYKRFGFVVTLGRIKGFGRRSACRQEHKPLTHSSENSC